MIITREKPLQEILSFIEKDNKIFIAGCSLCATTCKTGGEDQVKKMADFLEKEGKTITGYAVLDPACSLLAVKRAVREQKNEIDAAETILSMACGGGTQAIAEIIKNKNVYPVNDTLFQGEITESTLKVSAFEQRCSLCGDCMLSETGAIKIESAINRRSGNLNRIRDIFASS